MLFYFVKDESKIQEEFENNYDPIWKVIKKSPFHKLEQSLVKQIHVFRERKIALNGPFISNRSFITCLLFCHYWESMKRLQRISAISAKYSGSREIRSSEVLLYYHCLSLILASYQKYISLRTILYTPRFILSR